MPRPRLHLDADASIKALQSALIARGHDVTRTPDEWMAPDASNEEGTLLINAGAPILAIQRLLGHKNIDTTVAADYYRAMDEIERHLTKKTRSVLRLALANCWPWWTRCTPGR